MTDYTICFDARWIFYLFAFISGIATPLIIIAIVHDYKRNH